MAELDFGTYKYNGARALVILHERYMRTCLRTWQEAKRLDIKLPVTNDGDYQSLDTLLRHILRASRGYLTWMCEQLNLPDPEIEKTPVANRIAAEAENHLAHLLDKWRSPLAGVEEEHFHNPTYLSRWGTAYCIDAMLEHAVMHPIRHEFQLRNLISTAT